MLLELAPLNIASPPRPEDRGGDTIAAVPCAANDGDEKPQTSNLIHKNHNREPTTRQTL